MKLILWFAVFMCGLMPAQAQELITTATKAPETSSAAKAPDGTETSVNERVRLLETELERQNAKLDQLQKTISDQQAAIQALLDKAWKA